MHQQTSQILGGNATDEAAIRHLDWQQFLTADVAVMPAIGGTIMGSKSKPDRVSRFYWDDL